ncbi:MAG TPA: GRAM domain-containing protein [Ohtaekwangia sp.]|nr:GRAM domain-containing protein [Ohtaekwangia sp.]
MTKKILITALAFGLAVTVFLIIYNSIINDGITIITVVSTIIGGLIGSLLFAWIMQYSAKKLFKKIVIETNANEHILKEGGANHFKGKEGVGGKLVLTNTRLIFKSHKLNIQIHEENFDLDRVNAIKTTKTFNFLHNGLTLELKDNNHHRFIVDDPTDWVGRILRQKQLIN